MASTALARIPTGSGGMKKLYQRYVNLESAKKRVVAKTEETIGGIVNSLEVQASAFVFGAIQGYYLKSGGEVLAKKGSADKPGMHLFGTVPIELAVGVGLHTAALLGLGGKYSSHMRAFGDGAMAAYMAALGAGWGSKFRDEKDKAPKDSASGSLRQQIADLLDD